jgi:hypothetical protein
MVKVDVAATDQCPACFYSNIVSPNGPDSRLLPPTPKGGAQDTPNILCGLGTLRDDVSSTYQHQVSHRVNDNGAYFASPSGSCHGELEGRAAPFQTHPSVDLCDCCLMQLLTITITDRIDTLA